MENQAMINFAPSDFRGTPVRPVRVNRTEWQQLTEDLVSGTLALMSLWARNSSVYMALRDIQTKRIGVVVMKNLKGSFPSVGKDHAPAQRLERAIQDLHGLQPKGAFDARPWFDHGRWPVKQPLAKPVPGGDPVDYSFLPVECESLHQVPVGPVHAGIIEPGHFRFTAQGETVVRLEERLGYVHKGIDKLMQGANISCGLERLANHLGDIGAVCNDAAFAMMLAQCGILREQVLRIAHDCFGHRFMRDCVVPGGVTCNPDEDDLGMIRERITQIRDRFPAIIELFDNTASLKDRMVGTGILKNELATRFQAGGFVGRASGIDFDTRRDCAYAPYDDLTFDVPVLNSGDVNARVWVRIQEVQQSFQLIEHCLDQLPSGAVLTDVVPAGKAVDGLGLVEGFRGDILVWLSLDGKGRVSRCHMRDPSWFQWPLLEAVIEGNIIADFPVCNKSFNCSYSGHDL